jgi:hypothetical protein
MTDNLTNTTTNNTHDAQIWLVERFDENQLIEAKFNDALTPGYQVEFSPNEADRAGAFVEDALSEADALDSVVDLLQVQRPTKED